MADGYALSLQSAVVAALKADAGVSALVGGRVYGTPPQSAVRPFVGVGGFIPRPVRSSCGAAARVEFSIEASSRSVSSGTEATRCAEAVVAALDDAPLSLSGFALVYLHWQGQDVTRDKDGTGHTAVILFEALLDG